MGRVKRVDGSRNGKIVGLLIAVSLICVLITLGMKSGGADIVDYSKLKFEVKLENTEYLKDGIITFEKFKSNTEEDKLESLKLIEPMLESRVYNSLVKGVSTDYFNSYCISEYNKMYKNIQSLSARALYMDKIFKESGLKGEEVLYGEDDAVGMEDIADLGEYVSKNCIGKTRDLLLASNVQYRALREYEKANVEVVELGAKVEYLKDIIYDNVKNVDSARVSVWVKGDRGNWLSNLLKTKKDITEEDMRALKQVAVYKMSRYFNGIDSLDYKIPSSNILETEYSLCGLDSKDKYVIVCGLVSYKHGDGTPILGDNLEYYKDKALMVKAKESIDSKVASYVDQYKNE